MSSGPPCILCSPSYDEVGNKLTQTDAEGRSTSWAYDALGRISGRTLPMGQVETYLFDANSNRTSHTDFNGQTHAYVYDDMDRLLEENHADGSTTVHSYNAIGNRTQSTVTDTSDTRVWAYSFDTLNRLTLETKPNGSTLSYQYDAAGNKSQLTTTDVGGNSETISYGYDVLNRLASVTNTAGITSYGYDEVGNRTSLSYPNGTSQTWEYDTRNRLTSTSIYRANGVRIQSFDYTLHPTGRRTQITELNGRNSSYTYNNRYWLTGESITDAINGNYSASYQYDSVGNRTQSIEDGVTTAYSYDNNDRITQQGGVVYSYDENGNTVSEDDQGEITSYAYNGQNQLTAHTASGLTTRYQYNADGIRHSKTDFLATTQFLVDGNRDYAQVLAESIDGVSDVSYHFGDDLISQSRDADSRYFHTDGLGSTRVLTDTAGTTTDMYAFSAFGEVLNQTGASDNSYLYTGEQYDAGLGQYYLRARYYDQGVGRFTQMDTWTGNNSDPVTLQKYLYANLDPAVMIDPTGMFSIGSFGAGSTIIGILKAVDFASSAYDVFSLASDDNEITDRQIGSAVILAMLPGSSGIKLFRNISKKKKHGNNKKSRKPQHIYKIDDTQKYEIYKFGISGAPLNQNGTSGRANRQANRLNKPLGYKRYIPEILHRNIQGRIAALAIEYALVCGYKKTYGRKPIGNILPLCF